MVAATATAGTFSVMITGTLSDKSSASQDFTLVGNYPPVLSTTVFSDINIVVGQNGQQSIPSCSDPENNSITLKTYQTSLTALPVFATYNSVSSVINFNPTLFSQIG